ncbi:MAG: DNA polymerase/3'-5' exonuclease PolX [Bacteroidota bacterium]|nr:DNA polymerase/3'-5' exonuclease PolX [Bacteroidota bacterium]
MPLVNKELGKIFSDMSHIYQYKNGKEKFRAIAYEKAARVINDLQDDITTFTKKSQLEKIPGVGPSIAEKINEYIKTGKIKKFESLKKTVPIDILELMNISGFGPQSLKRIHQMLKINDRDELTKALQDGRISKIRGFGKKKVDNMLRSMKLHKTVEERMLLWNAMEAGNKVLDEFKKMTEVLQAELAGSLRRKKETIGDIDILVACDEKSRKKIIAKFVALPLIKEVLAKGDTKASVIIKEFNKQVDVRIINPDEWGSALLYFTGSKEHNVELRTIARDKGYKISEYGLFDIKTGKRIAGNTEEGIYKELEFAWIPPEMREQKGELDLAAKNKIPSLVTLADIKGDMHLHSTWSDGTMDIEDLAQFVSSHYPYEYIVLTDHSKSERVAGGMNEEQFIDQVKEIRRVNNKLKKDFIKTGVEVDIMADGSLDLKDDLLEQLDWVCASVHSGFTRDNTERIITACENKLVNCIGHPSGRLMGQREAYPVNWQKVFKVAKQTNTAFEINCQAERMDLNDDLARMARENGVMLTISTDSHQQSQFAFMQMGIFIARRAWCTKKDILNTASWNEIKKFIERKRKKTFSNEPFF